MNNVGRFLIGSGIIIVLFWIGGYDFNTRDSKAVTCAVIALVFGALGVATKDMDSLS